MQIDPKIGNDLKHIDRGLHLPQQQQGLDGNGGSMISTVYERGIK